MDGKYSVYKHTFPNGKIYIGITNQHPERRWRNDGSGYKNQIVLKAAIQKYGWNNIKHEILFSDLSKEQAFAKEIELISFYHSTDHEHGYNTTIGGDGKSCEISEETKLKLRDAHLGKPLSEEHKKKIGLANKGRKISEEQKARLLVSNKGRTLSYETKEKIKAKLSKKTAQMDSDGVIIKIYDSTKQAFNETRIRHIPEACNGNRKTAGGFVWKYV